MDCANGTIQGVPHYSVIELRAHELGWQLSRQIQERHLQQMVVQQAARGACPGCGTSCELKPVKRKVTSIDGAVAASELRGHCPRCRRAFFPLRVLLDFDTRELTPVLAQRLVRTAAETRSFDRAAIVMDESVGIPVSAKMIERVVHDVG